MSIVSPTEKAFQKNQARIWKAKIGDFQPKGNERYDCYWTWYVDEEKKWENLKGCASTRNFPFEAGELKAEVRVDFIKTSYKPVGEASPGEEVEINIDYVLGLIKQYHEDHTKNKEILVDINKAIDSSIELRNKKELINQFITSLDIHSIVDEDWQEFVEEKKVEELEKIIENENLDKEATYKFIKNAFRDGSVPIVGTAIAKILPPTTSRFDPDGGYGKKRGSVLDKLTSFFNKFFDISGQKF